MSKQKSVFVTAIVAVMLGIIVFAAYKLLFPAFVVIVGALSGVGFIAGARVFCRWLEAEREPELTKLTPVMVEPVESFDYESIREEVRAEDG